MLYFQRTKKKGRTNDMEKYTTKQDGRARTISTLGGDYALKWDCEAADVRYLFKARRTKGVRGEFLSQTALFAGLSVIAANLWNIFTRLGGDGSHREAATSRPLLQSCIARITRHARQGIVTIYTATGGKAREAYRAISAFLAKVSSASQLTPEERRQLIVAYALRRYGLVRRLFPPLIGRQATLPLC